MTVNVKDFGAVGDGKTLNTKAIQAAINECNAAGGGKVVISNGTFMTGTLVMKSNVHLSIEAGSVLLASSNCGSYTEDSPTTESRPYPYNTVIAGEIADYGDYPEIEKKYVDISALPRNRGNCLIYAEEAENFSITGMGKIDCNGTAFVEVAPSEANHYTKFRRIHAPTPARVVFFAGCKNVNVENISIVNSPGGWAYWVHDCDFVTFDRVKVIADPDYPNNDGIHVNCSRHITVSNANIVCSDDCIIIRANSRSLQENKPCENVTVTNCNLTTPCAGVRIAFVNDGAIRNCAISNCVMTNTGVGILIDFPDQKLIQSDFGREASLVENISVSNIIMNPVRRPVRISINPAEETMIDAVRHLYFSEIHAQCAKMPVIKGRKGNPVEDIQFNNCTFDCKNDERTFTMEYVKNISFNNTRFTNDDSIIL